jgi:hypothetical protein
VLQYFNHSAEWSNTITEVLSDKTAQCKKGHVLTRLLGRACRYRYVIVVIATSSLPKTQLSKGLGLPLQKFSIFPIEAFPLRLSPML